MVSGLSRPTLLRAAFFGFALLGGAFPLGARGSILLLGNGDRLTGTVIKETDGKLYFHSDILGDIVAPLNTVTIIENPPFSATAVEAAAGVPQPPAKPAGPEAAATSAPPSTAKILGKVPGQPVVLTPPPPAWTGKVEFGYNNAVSNDTRTVNLSLLGQAEHVAGPDDLLFKGRFLYNSSGGVASADKEDADARWRHNLSQRVFLQTDGSYDSDRIQLIRYELQQTVALGYKLFQSTRETVDVGAGVIGQYLDATGVDKGTDYLGDVFEDYTFKINRWYTFTEDLSAQDSPETRGRFGIVSDTGLPVSGSARDYAYKFHTTLQGKINPHLSLNLHYEYEFDNAILDSVNRVEQRITTTLGYGF